MRTLPPLWPLAALAAALAGCSHIDITPQDNPDRVLTGTVAFNGGVTLPDDAQVVVRVVDPVPPPQIVQVPGDTTMKHQAPPPNPPPDVLGEKTILHPGLPPIPFKVEYQADADQLRHGLNIEVRVSYGGRVRYSNFIQYSVGSNDELEPHTVWVDPVR